MRSTVPLAILLSACAAPSRYVGARANVHRVPQVLAGLAGVWNGRLYRSDADDVGMPFSLLQGDCTEARVVAQLAFTGAAEPPAPVQLLEASATTYVALAGPYHDAATGQVVVTVLEARRTGDRLHGTYRTQPLGGGRATTGRFAALRSQLAAA